MVDMYLPKRCENIVVENIKFKVELDPNKENIASIVSKTSVREEVVPVTE